MTKPFFFQATVYRGLNYVTPVKVMAKQICPGVAQIDCIECGGTGDWPFGPTPDECGPCVECKGTGKVYIGSF